MKKKAGWLESFYSEDYRKRVKSEFAVIENFYDLTDDKVYEWHIYRSKKHYNYLAANLIIYLIGPILVGLFVYFTLSTISLKIAFWYAFGCLIWYSIKMIAAIMITYLIPIIKKNIETNIFKAGKLNQNLSFVISALAFLMYSNYSYFEGLFSSYESIADWLLFYLDNLLKIVLLDTIEILGFNFSTIEPIHWKGKTLIYIFNLLLTIGLVDSIIMIFKQANLNLFFHGTTKDFVSKAYDIGSSGSYNIKFKRIGLTKELKEEPEFLLESFMFKFDDLLKMISKTNEESSS